MIDKNSYKSKSHGPTDRELLLRIVTLLEEIRDRMEIAAMEEVSRQN